MKWGNGCETGKILDLRGRFLLGEQKYEKDWQEVVTMKQGEIECVVFGVGVIDVIEYHCLCCGSGQRISRCGCGCMVF